MKETYFTDCCQTGEIMASSSGVMKLDLLTFISKICFHFQNVLSFSKCALISKMCFHFQNVLSFSIMASCSGVMKLDLLTPQDA